MEVRALAEIDRHLSLHVADPRPRTPAAPKIMASDARAFTPLPDVLQTLSKGWDASVNSNQVSDLCQAIGDVVPMLSPNPDPTAQRVAGILDQALATFAKDGNQVRFQGGYLRGRALLPDSASTTALEQARDALNQAYLDRDNPDFAGDPLREDLVGALSDIAWAGGRDGSPLGQQVVAAINTGTTPYNAMLARYNQLPDTVDQTILGFIHRTVPNPEKQQLLSQMLMNLKGVQDHVDALVPGQREYPPPLPPPPPFHML